MFEKLTFFSKDGKIIFYHSFLCQSRGGEAEIDATTGLCAAAAEVTSVQHAINKEYQT